MHRDMDPNGVDDRTLMVLNLWPEGTIAHVNYARLIVALNRLCKEFGYGCAPQIAVWIEDLWRNPERYDHYEAQRAEQLSFMSEHGPGGTETQTGG